MMEQNMNKGNQSLEPKRDKGNFKEAAWLAALSWILFPAGFIAAIICVIYYRTKGRHDIVRGIWTGLGIGFAVLVVVLGVTCFSLMNNIQ